MTALCLLVAVVSFMLFGLSNEHHHRRRLQVHLLAKRKRLLRLLAWIGIALCLTLAFGAVGHVYGAMLWIGSLSFGAAVSFLYLNLAPPRR
jgi:hypothetical protein